VPAVLAGPGVVVEEVVGLLQEESDLLLLPPQQHQDLLPVPLQDLPLPFLQRHQDLLLLPLLLKSPLLDLQHLQNLQPECWVKLHLKEEPQPLPN
jgi:hypothetical protein